MIRACLLLFLWAQADGRRVATVDLTAVPKNDVPKNQSFGPASASGRAGGVLGPSGYPIPPHVPFPVNVKILDFAKSSNPAPWSVALEVAVTNTGTEPVWVPVGTDWAKLLAPSARGRRLLGLSVWTVGNHGRPGWVGGSAAVSNEDDPQSAIELSPGDYVIYKVSVDGRVEGLSACVQNAGNDGCRVTVMAGLDQKTLDHGADYSEPISDPIQAVNSLKWAPPRR